VKVRVYSNHPIDAMDEKGYKFLNIFIRREFLWQSEWGLMDLGGLAEMFSELP